MNELELLVLTTIILAKEEKAVQPQDDDLYEAVQENNLYEAFGY